MATVVARGSELATAVPWLGDYYRQRLQADVAQRMGRLAIPLDNLDEAIIGNVVGYDMRFETHVDGQAINANDYVQGFPGDRLSYLALGAADARTYDEVWGSHNVAKLPRVVGTRNIVAAQAIPHTIGVVASRPEWTFRGPSPDRGRYSGYMQQLLREAVFTAPDISDPRFWEQANISLNFAYTTPDTVASMVTDRVYGGDVAA